MRLVKGVLVYVCLPTLVNLLGFYLLGLNAFPIVVTICSVLGALYLFLLFRYRAQATTRVILLVCLLVIITVGGFCTWVFIRGATLYIDNQPVTGRVVKVEGGSVLIDPPPDNDGKYIRYSKVTLTPVPDDKHRFNQWGDEVSGMEPEKTIRLTSDKHISTEFIRQYIVHVSVNPDTKGTTYPSPGEYKVDAGSTFLAKAIPYQNCRFDSWLLNSSTVTLQTLSITVESDVNLEVIFIRQYELISDVKPADGGNIDPAPGTHIYDEGSVVIITAIPDDGFRFEKWLGHVSSDSPSISMLMTEDEQITAVFKRQHTLTVYSNPSDGGTTQPASGMTYVFDEGAEVILCASPVDGYRFKGFTGDINDTSPNLSLTIDRDIQISAEFIRVFSLIITTNRADGGFVTPSPGISYHDNGDNVILTATPASGFRFGGWTGDVVSGDQHIDIEINKNMTLAAHFIKTFTLTLLTNSMQMGSVSGAGTYDEGTTVDISATPNPGFGLKNWSGDITSTESSVIFTINRNMTVTAIFAKIVNLTVTINPSSSGLITPGSSPQIKDSEVSLKATAAPGWRFFNWSGDISSQNPEVSIRMDSDKSVTANFKKIYNLQVNINPPGSAAVTPASGTYDAGTVVTITLTPSGNYILGSWSGDASGSANTIQVLMDSNKTVTANMIFWGDMVKLPDTIHLCTAILNGNAVDNSSSPNSYDGDFESCFSFKSSGGDGPAVRELTLISEHEFSRPATIKQIKYRFYADSLATGEYIRQHQITLYFEYFSDGAWHELPNSRYDEAGGEGEAHWDSGMVTYSGTLTNVTKIRAYCYAYSWISGGEASANSEAKIFEIQAWGS